MKNALFQPGQILATPAAVRAMRKAAAQPEDYLRRHFSGNWGFVGIPAEVNASSGGKPNGIPG